MYSSGFSSTGEMSQALKPLEAREVLEHKREKSKNKTQDKEGIQVGKERSHTRLA
jgi:hypothetical protein